MSEPCTCYSYNKTVGTKPEVPLVPPARLAAERADPTRPIMVDACIAPAVRAVWDAGHITLGSCCGHGGTVSPRPSLVLENGEKDYDGIKAAIATVDDRTFELLQWQLVEVGLTADHSGGSTDA